jgi:hypothetical protein
MIGKIGTFTLITTMITTCSFARNSNKQDQEHYPEKERVDYGTNSITVSPFTVMDYGVGLGLSYEKIFGANGYLGLILPFSLMLDGNNSPGYSYNASGLNPSFYFTPGFKIYPFGQSRLTYAFGSSFMLNYGKRNSVWYTNFPVDGASVSWLRMGAMVNNYLNFQVTQSIGLGLGMGLGVRFLDRQTYTEPGLATPLKLEGKVKPTGCFALTISFRF